MWDMNHTSNWVVRYNKKQRCLDISEFYDLRPWGPEWEILEYFYKTPHEEVVEWCDKWEKKNPNWFDEGNPPSV